MRAQICSKSQCVTLQSVWLCCLRAGELCVVLIVWRRHEILMTPMIGRQTWQMVSNMVCECVLRCVWYLPQVPAGNATKTACTASIEVSLPLTLKGTVHQKPKFQKNIFISYHFWQWKLCNVTNHNATFMNMQMRATLLT